MSKKKDIKQVDSLAKKYGMSPEERPAFRDHIHELTRSGAGGSRSGGDFTFHELEKLRER